MLLWLSVAGAAAYCFMVTSGFSHGLSWLVMLIFFNLAMGNLFFPRPEGYVYWPVYHWLRRQRPAYVKMHRGRKVLARDEGLGEERLYGKDGVWIGSWYADYEINLLTLLNLQHDNTPIPSSLRYLNANEHKRLSPIARFLSRKLR